MSGKMVIALGTVGYLVLGATIDSILPGAALLGMNMQGIVFSTVCLLLAVWLAVRLDLLG